jgi:hypothetical protein
VSRGTQVSWSKQLGLAVVLVALGYFAYWAEYKHKPQKEEAEAATKKLVQLKDVSVQSLRVVNGDEVFELVCNDFEQKLCKPGDNSKWQLTEPRALRADDSNVNAILSAINNVAVSDTIDLSTETAEKKAQLLKDYGLDDAARSRKDARKIVLRTPNEITIWLGETHPIGDGIFTLVSGSESKVLVLPSYFRSNLEHDLTYWRDKKILTIGGHEVAGFKLDSSKGKIEGERKEGTWVLKAGGEELPGDLETIDSLLSGASYLTARQFAADDKNSPAGKQALAGATRAVQLELRKEAPKPNQPSEGSTSPDAQKKPAAPELMTLTLFRKGKDAAKKVYATVSNLDPVYEVDNAAIERFEKMPKDLRLNKLITSMDRFTAKKLEFSSDALAPPLLLESKDSKWMVAPLPGQGKETEAASDKVQSLLDRLTGNRIKDFLPASKMPAGIEKGIALTLADEKDPNKRRFIFWKSGENLYARDMSSKRKEAYLVDTAVWEVLPKSRDHFSAQAAQTQQPAAEKK